MDVCALVQLELYYEKMDKMDHVKLKHPNTIVVTPNQVGSVLFSLVLFAH